MTRIPSKIALPLALLALAAAPAAAAGAERDRPAGRAAKLQRALDRVVAAGAPGTLALVRERDRTIRLASGYADLKVRRPMRSTDRFRMGSVTKTFVATVVLQLVSEGRLSLTDTIEDRLPGLVPNGQAITVRQLLNMTSGLFDYPKDPRIFAPFLQGGLAHAWAPRELVAVATSQAPLFAPGTGYAYCNTCYVLLGLMIEATSDKPLKAELRQRILRPLRLRATSFRDDAPDRRAPRARLHASRPAVARRRHRPQPFMGLGRGRDRLDRRRRHALLPRAARRPPAPPRAPAGDADHRRWERGSAVRARHRNTTPPIQHGLGPPGRHHRLRRVGAREPRWQAPDRRVHQPRRQLLLQAD